MSRIYCADRGPLTLYVVSLDNDESINSGKFHEKFLARATTAPCIEHGKSIRSFLEAPASQHLSISCNKKHKPKQ